MDTTLGKRLWGLTLKTNSEPESLRQSNAVLNTILATPLKSLVPSCIVYLPCLLAIGKFDTRPFLMQRHTGIWVSSENKNFVSRSLFEEPHVMNLNQVLFGKMGLFIDFNGMSICLRLFYVSRLGNQIYCMLMFVFFV